MKPEEEYDIFKKYDERIGDYVRTWGVFLAKGRNGQFHECHVMLKKVYSPPKPDERLILRLKDIEIEELRQRINQFEIEKKLNAAAKQ